MFAQVNHHDTLNPFAKAIWSRILADRPDWKSYFGTREQNNLEVAIPAPARSAAGHLIVFTTDATQLWIRFSPSQACYPIDDADDLGPILKSLLNDEIVFVIIHEGERWVETTLGRQGDQISLEAGQSASVISWSGQYDKTLPS